MRELEMVCGNCSSYLSAADEESSTAILSLAWRFANAHVNCGYMTAGAPDEPADSLEEQESLEQE